MGSLIIEVKADNGRLIEAEYSCIPSIKSSLHTGLGHNQEEAEVFPDVPARVILEEAVWETGEDLTPMEIAKYQPRLDAEAQAEAKRRSI